MTTTLILEDGSIYKGKHFGAYGTKIGELVFNTSMSGYQDILTDPSYSNQMVIMAYPEIGNYGINLEDSKKTNCFGLIVKSYCKSESHYESKKNLSDFMKEKDIIGIEEIDTRSLIIKLREKGSMKCMLTTDEVVSENDITEKIAATCVYKPNKNLIEDVTTNETYTINESGEIDLAFIDFGAKKETLNCLAKRGCKITVYPYNTSYETILSNGHKGLFLSSGPGNPKDYTEQVKNLENLVGKIPMFGIGLGYQLLSIVLGAKTYKLKYGHRGVNYPVIDLVTKKVMMTDQNHGYAIEKESLSGIMLETHKNLNDDTIEGFSAERLKIFGVQFNPESIVGLSDSSVIYDKWIELMKEYQALPTRKADDMANV